MQPDAESTSYQKHSSSGDHNGPAKHLCIQVPSIILLDQAAGDWRTAKTANADNRRNHPHFYAHLRRILSGIRKCRREHALNASCKDTVEHSECPRPFDGFHPGPTVSEDGGSRDDDDQDVEGSDEAICGPCCYKSSGKSYCIDYEQDVERG